MQQLHTTTLCNLKVVSMLRQHERLGTNGSRLVVDRPSVWQGLRRWLRGDRRDLDVEMLEQNFMSGILIFQTCTQPHRKLRVAQELLLACNGLVNLQTTYEHDTEIVARIQHLLDTVRFNVGLIDRSENSNLLLG